MINIPRFKLFLWILLLPHFLAAQLVIDRSPGPTQASKRLEHWVYGEIVFVDGTVLNAAFAFNPLLPEGMLKIKYENTIIAGTVREVESFHYYDPQIGQSRDFASFPVDKTHQIFVEILQDRVDYALLGKPTVRRGEYISYGATFSEVQNHYRWFLYNKHTEDIHWLDKKKLIALMPNKKKEVRKYFRKHQYTKDPTQLYAEVIDMFMEFK